MLLELKSVTKTYNQRHILKDLSLQVDKGDTIAVTGPSGSGKTTLLNIIGGIDVPDSGSVIFNGSQVEKFTKDELAVFRNTRIGFVFQMHYLLPQCTLLENILIPVLVMKDRHEKSKAKERALSLIDRVGIMARKDQYPRELSGGECQRAAFVRALINNPELILADEPTGSLDNESADIMGRLLLELNKENNATLVVVTHSPELAKLMGRQVRLKSASLV